jgi:putative transcriptional regulator
MSRTLIRWKLSEIMARHRVKGKDLANYIGISTNAMSALRNALVLPEIGGDRWEQICAGINELSKIGETITPFDLIEYIPSSDTSAADQSSRTSKTHGSSTLKKDATTPETKSLLSTRLKRRKRAA